MQQLSAHRTVYAMRILWRMLAERFREVRASQVAGSLAFTTLLGIVPLLAIILATVGRLPQFASLASGLQIFLLQNLLPDKAGKVITTYALQFGQKATSLTLVGIILLAVTALMLLFTIERSFNKIWALPRTRPWATRIPIYWVGLTLGPIIFAASVAASGYVLNTSLSVVGESHWLHAFIYRLLSLALLASFFACLFHLAPGRHLHIGYAWTGGLIAALGILLLQRLLGLYFAKFPTYTLIYGAFSVLPILLIWLYSGWLVILVGAIIAAVLPEFRARGSLLPNTPATNFYALLLIVLELVKAQRNGIAASLSQIAHNCRLPHDDATKLLLKAQSLGWTISTSEGDWVLACRADAISLREIFEATLFSPDIFQRLVALRDSAERARLVNLFTRIQAMLDQPAEQFLR